MAKHRLIEDETLMALFKEEAVWKEAYECYRPTFIAFTSKHYGLSLEKAEALMAEAFSGLRLLIGEGKPRQPLKRPLFAELLLIADVFWRRDAEAPPGERRLTFEAACRQGPYLSSDVLARLLQKSHVKATNELFQSYRDSALAIMHAKFRAASPEPEEFYGTAFNELLRNAAKQKIRQPMTSRLFTYFFQIFWNTYYTEWKKNAKRLEEVSFPEGLEGNLPDLAEEDGGYDLPPGFDTATAVIDTLLNELDEVCQTVIALRYYSEPDQLLPWREVGKIMEISENNARQKGFDCLERLRKKLKEYHSR
jgi:RNA polymerase sigma factor (sigma-70 family)